MNRCPARHSRPTLFVAVVALSAVAFVGQALAATAISDATAIAAHLATFATPR